MKIKTLVENTSISEDFRSEHGLSLYIETGKHKLLFDLGASTLFIENAKKLGVDLSEVDLVVISHGHYDHGGGLEAFLSVNSNAKIYLNQRAFNMHYSNKLNGEKTYIGLNENLIPNNRFIFAGDQLVIDEELELFSNVKGKRLRPSGNKDLLMKVETSFVQDSFSHEQNLIIKENGQTLLVAGCAHNGIVNILDHFHTEKDCFPGHVIGGFHLYSRSANKNEDIKTVNLIGEYLKDTGSKYYTCHCTGIESYNRLKIIMGEKIDYLSTGDQLII